MEVRDAAVCEGHVQIGIVLNAALEALMTTEGDFSWSFAGDIEQGGDIMHAETPESVLDGAGFAMERGERVCLLGRNGAGKSTLMKLLDGTIRPDAGEVVRQGGVTVARLAAKDAPAARAVSTTD
jgi:ABC-type polysaccharide/polyol phosphate transport system ATPase subunit